MQKTILFDLDGTLTDSGEGIMNCAQLALEHFGIPIPPRTEMRVFVGPPLSETFLKFGIPADQIDEAIRIFRNRYLPIGKYENYPYPGIPEMLEKLKQHGNTLCVATSKPEETAREILDHFQLSQYFHCICGATFDHTRNSKSEVIAFLLEQYGNNHPFIMVGDTKFDVIGAAAHQIATVGVSWGYGNVDEMRAAGAFAIADTPEMLLNILEH